MKRFLSEIAYDVQFVKGHKLQPAWFKILKIFILPGAAAGFAWFFGWRRTLVFLAVFVLLSLIVHLTYRVKTGKFTRNWADFIVVADEEKGGKQSIGLLYYSWILANAVIAFLVSRAAG
jgi:hypothetical protein